MNKFLLSIFLAALTIGHINANAQTSINFEKTADSLFEAKNYQSAIDLYSQAISLQKQSKQLSELYTKSGECKANLKMHNEAIEDETIAIKYNSHNRDAYWNRAMYYEETKAYKQAADDYTTAMKYFTNENHNLSKLYDNRAYVKLEQKLYKEALADDSIAIKLNPKNELAHWHKGQEYNHIGQYQLSIDSYKSALVYEDDKGDMAQLFDNIASNESSLKNYSKAIDDENIAINFNPGEVNYYINRAIAYQGHHDFQLAIDDYSNAIAHVKNNDAELGVLYVAKAVSELGIRDSKNALIDDSIGIKLCSQFGYAYRVRGIIYSSIGQHQAAIDQYKKAMPFYADRKIEYANLYSAYISSEYYLGNADSLVVHCTNTIALNPENPAPYFTRGKTYLKKLNEKDAAFKDFRKVIELDTSRKSIDYIFATFYLGNSEAALNKMKSIILSSTNIEAESSAYYNMACLLSLMNKPDDANIYLKSAIDKGYARQYAFYDDDFDNIRNTPDFKNMITDSIKH
jgi:tetratricopeptide (TPR) repeat protein